MSRLYDWFNAGSEAEQNALQPQEAAQEPQEYPQTQPTRDITQLMQRTRREQQQALQQNAGKFRMASQSANPTPPSGWQRYLHHSNSMQKADPAQAYIQERQNNPSAAPTQQSLIRQTLNTLADNAPEHSMRPILAAGLQAMGDTHSASEKQKKHRGDPTYTQPYSTPLIQISKNALEPNPPELQNQSASPLYQHIRNTPFGKRVETEKPWEGGKGKNLPTQESGIQSGAHANAQTQQGISRAHGVDWKQSDDGQQKFSGTAPLEPYIGLGQLKKLASLGDILSLIPVGAEFHNPHENSTPRLYRVGVNLGNSQEPLGKNYFDELTEKAETTQEKMLESYGTDQEQAKTALKYTKNVLEALLTFNPYIGGITTLDKNWGKNRDMEDQSRLKNTLLGSGMEMGSEELTTRSIDKIAETLGWKDPVTRKIFSDGSTQLITKTVDTLRKPDKDKEGLD